MRRHRYHRHSGKGYAGTDEPGPQRIRSETGEWVPERAAHTPLDDRLVGGDEEGGGNVGTELGDDSSVWGGSESQHPEQDRSGG